MLTWRILPLIQPLSSVELSSVRMYQEPKGRMDEWEKGLFERWGKPDPHRRAHPEFQVSAGISGCALYST